MDSHVNYHPDKIKLASPLIKVGTYSSDQHVIILHRFIALTTATARFSSGFWSWLELAFPRSGDHPLFFPLETNWPTSWLPLLWHLIKWFLKWDVPLVPDPLILFLQCLQIATRMSPFLTLSKSFHTTDFNLLELNITASDKSIITWTSGFMEIDLQQDGRELYRGEQQQEVQHRTQA